MKVLLTRDMQLEVIDKVHLPIEFETLVCFDYRRIVSIPFLKNIILTDSYDLIVLTSPATIDIYRKLNIDTPIACMSPASAGKVKDLCPLYLTKKPYNGKNLASYIIEEKPNKNNKIIILSGKNGQEELFDNLVNYYDYVNKMNVYERFRPDYDIDHLRSSLEPHYDLIIFTCNTAIEHYLEYLTDINKPYNLEINIIVPSERVKKFAESKGFTKINVASSIDSEDIISEIVKVYEQNG